MNIFRFLDYNPARGRSRYRFLLAILIILLSIGFGVWFAYTKSSDLVTLFNNQQVSFNAPIYGMIVGATILVLGIGRGLLVVSMGKDEPFPLVMVVGLGLILITFLYVIFL